MIMKSWLTSSLCDIAVKCNEERQEDDEEG
jgi:hypothetical protein